MWLQSSALLYRQLWVLKLIWALILLAVDITKQCCTLLFSYHHTILNTWSICMYTAGRRSSSPSTFTTTSTGKLSGISSSATQKKRDRVHNNVRAELTSHQYRVSCVYCTYSLQSSSNITSTTIFTCYSSLHQEIGNIHVREMSYHKHTSKTLGRWLTRHTLDG